MGNTCYHCHYTQLRVSRSTLLRFLDHRCKDCGCQSIYEPCNRPPYFRERTILGLAFIQEWHSHTSGNGAKFGPLPVTLADQTPCHLFAITRCTIFGSSQKNCTVLTSRSLVISENSQTCKERALRRRVSPCTTFNLCHNGCQVPCKAQKRKVRHAACQHNPFPYTIWLMTP